MNGDVLTDLRFSGFLDRHASGKRLFTISAARRTEITEYGVLCMSTRGHAERFEEKPENKYLVSMGVYGVDRPLLTNVSARDVNMDSTT